MEATKVQETVPVPYFRCQKGHAGRLSQTPALFLHIREKVIFTFYYRASKRAHAHETGATPSVTADLDRNGAPAT